MSRSVEIVTKPLAAWEKRNGDDPKRTLVIELRSEDGKRASVMRISPDEVAMLRVALSLFERDEGPKFIPTDEQIERTARMLFARTKEGRDGFSWPLNPGAYKERDLENARTFLINAVGSVNHEGAL